MLKSVIAAVLIKGKKMGEKLYRPIIKDGDHLVQSKSNPNRVRGQSRDAENKNPDIVEWEEVDVPSSDPTGEESYYQFEQSDYDYQGNDAEDKSTLELLVETLENINKFLEYLNEHPEIIESIVKGGRKIKRFVSNGFVKLKAFIRRDKNHAVVDVVAASAVDEKSVALLEVKEESLPSVAEENASEERSDAEELSMEEARNIMLDTLSNYLMMRRNIEKLSKAKIKNAETVQIEMDQMLLVMDQIVNRYPALMDESTSKSILEMLGSNVSSSDRKRILESLKMEN